MPPGLTLDTFVRLPVVAGIDLIGAPVATTEAATFSFAAISTALATGNLGGAFAGLVDAPAVIANGFLNGQATLPLGLSLTNVPALGNVATVEANLNLPLDGIIHPPGFYAATVTVGVPNVLPPTTINVGVGGTPFSGLAPFTVNYAPEQLALAIGGPPSPPPVIDVPLITIWLWGGPLYRGDFERACHAGIFAIASRFVFRIALGWFRAGHRARGRPTLTASRAIGREGLWRRLTLGSLYGPGCDPPAAWICKLLHNHAESSEWPTR